MEERGNVEEIDGQPSEKLHQVEENLQILLLNGVKRLTQCQDSLQDAEMDKKLVIIEHMLDCIEKVRRLC